MNTPLGSFPARRPRRLRHAPWLRSMVAEHTVSGSRLVWPVFVDAVASTEHALASMPGVNRYGIDRLLDALGPVVERGLQAVAVFPQTPAHLKSPEGTEATNPDNLACQAIARIRRAFPELGIIADVALDPYTTHGHDGIWIDGRVDNDRTLEILRAQALTLAQAGASVVAPSDMMDGRVGAIRNTLDAAGHQQVPILAYTAKYASAFYGPFRDAVGSAAALGRGSKATYQMSPSQGREAAVEAMLDMGEGADMLMVKPGMPYLDIVRDLALMSPLPVFAYQVSGEYAMLRWAAERGGLNWRDAVLESLIGFERAGAAGVFCYAAPEVLEWLGATAG